MVWMSLCNLVWHRRNHVVKLCLGNDYLRMLGVFLVGMASQDLEGKRLGIISEQNVMTIPFLWLFVPD